MAKQPELTGVVGYVNNSVAQGLKSSAGCAGVTDVRLQQGNDQVLMRVKNEDISDVIPGTAAASETRVHILLRPGSMVETVVKMFRDVKSIEDPTLTRLTAAASVSVSFV